MLYLIELYGRAKMEEGEQKAEMFYQTSPHWQSHHMQMRDIHRARAEKKKQEMLSIVHELLTSISSVENKL